MAVIAGITGSASGVQGIALPILGPIYLARGVDPEALHRVVAIASGSLDSLPHNGYVVTTIRAICGETHKDAYAPVGVTTGLCQRSESCSPSRFFRSWPVSAPR